MKKDLNGRRVVIVQQGKKGNIEQAIFILKKDVESTGEDYILEEARKIVDDFVQKNGMKVKKGQMKWIVFVSIVSVVLMCIYFYFKI